MSGLLSEPIKMIFILYLHDDKVYTSVLYELVEKTEHISACLNHHSWPIGYVVGNRIGTFLGYWYIRS
jgi:hypothetical protein